MCWQEKKDLYTLHITKICSLYCTVYCSVRYSAGNYNLLDNESTRGIDFLWELPLLDEESPRQKNAIPPGITISWTRNPHKEGNSTGNCRLLDEESI
jgi:hypothetical protein